ncbi:hypothetical protein J2T07_003380 [Luteibacter jiangsuensis]|uniref:Uncharacterized protein n=1 Tax=Luteibacter jiangsuensis TaxID=637577 RepID=A0ABT9T2G8_9GAMM|nr:hypothetical protein [Luteibacter jiangsuensis]MDQ0011170.1 hypothetical protein [Luteibacter jiangsuensis]
MNTHSRSTASLADVKQLTYFQIYKTHPSEEHGTIKLFSNGNQQCPIKVGLVAADANENPITLTAEELKTALKLIFYDDGSALGDGYASSFDQNRFTWTESAIPASHPDAEPSRAPRDDLPAAIQVVTFYVSAASGSSGRALAARFEVTPELFFTTSPSVHDSEGQERDGEFDSSVEVLLAEPPFLSATDFGAASNGIVTGRKVGDSTTYFYWATEYYLNPKLNGIALPLDSVGSKASVGGNPPAGAFGFYTHGDFFAHVQWGVSYYSKPGDTVAESGGLPMPPLHSLVAVSAPHDASPNADYPYAMYETCVGHIVGPDKHRIVIGILKGNLARQFRNVSGGTVAEVSGTTMHILDAYGNDHTLSLSYNASKDEFTIG